MAGTLTISTLSDGTNSTSATNCIQGSAKAWVNFNGTTATPSTINASYNVSSVTKIGTGNYTLNFTNALSDANYAVNFGLCGGTTTNNAAFVGYVVATTQTGPPTNKTTTACQIAFCDYTSTTKDFTQCYVSVFR